MFIRIKRFIIKIVCKVNIFSSCLRINNNSNLNIIKINNDDKETQTIK